MSPLVSGEPQNWLCAPTIPASDKDFDPSWMIEDGGVARAALEECTKLARGFSLSQAFVDRATATDDGFTANGGPPSELPSQVNSEKP